MPTGYTADVQNGKIKDFPTFAMQCARAFGALIEMRDEPANAIIPTAFKPKIDYYEKEKFKLENELSWLKLLSKAEIAKEAHRKYCEELEKHYKCIEDVKLQKQRYETMLNKVLNWEPPSEDHKELKNFMVQQLRESINFDCVVWFKEPAPISAAEWYNKKIAYLEKRLEQIEEDKKEEIQRTEDRNRWLKQLRNSLREYDEDN